MSTDDKDNVIDLGSYTHAGDGKADVLALIEELYKRAIAGTVAGLAVIEHQRDGAVVIQISSPCNYHYVNSGAARLAHYLAGMGTQQQHKPGAAS
jgi:hypothetical protein